MSTRRPLVAGNWKMHLDRAAAVALAQGVVAGAKVGGRAELAVCPPSCYLDTVGQIVRGTPVALGAQNLYFESQGAFTGEISAPMVADLGCRYAILGHSERRHVFGETDADVARKARAALTAGLVPVVCVGELLAEREAGQTSAVIRRQFVGSLAGLSAEEVAGLVIAYEPVWAIGTGKVATPAQAQEVHAELRSLAAERYNPATAAAVRILYGGSVKAANAGELLAQADVDGALVGGASLKADEFLAIAQAAPAA